MDGVLNIDLSDILSKDKEKIRIEVDVANEYGAYVKNGDKYDVDSSVDLEETTGTIGFAITFIGEDFSMTMNAENAETSDSSELTCKISIGKADIPELGAEVEEYEAAFGKLREKYDKALRRAEDDLEIALSRLDPEKQVDTWETVSCYNGELGVYFEFEVFCEEGDIGFDYSLSDVYFTDTYCTYFVKSVGGSAPAIYNFYNPTYPIENFANGYEV